MISFDIKDLAAVAGSLRRRVHASPGSCVAGSIGTGVVKLGVFKAGRDSTMALSKQGLIKTESDQNRVRDYRFI